MADVASAPWFPVLTLLLGFGTKYVSDLIQHRWTVEKEREEREANRQEKRTERRNDFQRQTLLALQEEGAKLARFSARVQIADEEAYRKNKDTWRNVALPEGLNEDSRVCQAKVKLLTVRVYDDEARDLAEKFSLACAQVGLAKTIEGSRTHMEDMVVLYHTFNDRAGRVIRELDKAEA